MITLLIFCFLNLAKLRNLLPKQFDPASFKKQLSNALTNPNILNPSFLSPLFNMQLDNLRPELLLDAISGDKVDSFLLSNTLAASVNQAASRTGSSKSSSSSSSSAVKTPGIPPPAHQNSSSRRESSLDTLDLRFKKTSSNRSSLPSALIPAHKPTLAPPVPEEKGLSASSSSVLDLSSGVSLKRKSDPGLSQSAANNAARKSKKLKSRIDDLAFNLRQKKMMQVKQGDCQDESPDVKSKFDLDSLHSKNVNLRSKSTLSAPPAAHSGSSKLTDKLSSSSKLSLPSTSLPLNAYQPHSRDLRHKSSSSSSSSSLKLNDSTSILEQIMALKPEVKKWFEENPKLLTDTALMANLLSQNTATAAALASNVIIKFLGHNQTTN